MMNLKPIRNHDELSAALVRIEELWGAPIDTPEGNELEILSLLVEKYEDEHFPIKPSNPVEAIKFRMEQQGLQPKDLEPFIGGSGRVSEVLSKKRRLTLPMIRKLNAGLNIPLESLVNAY